jgi:DNA repair exonuclease SbcCD ATPase subunit
MKNIQFNKVKLVNFRCHIETELEFPNNKLVSIVGPNGKGKSSYFMALMIALYGKTAEGIELPDLVNKKEGKNLEVEVDFLVDTDEYLIKRYYKHSKHSNKLYLYLNGTDISGKTTTDTYKRIEQILVPKQVFLNSIYFSQQVKDFFTSLNDSQQKQIFSSILQLEEWKRYKEYIDEDSKTLTIEVDNQSREFDKIEVRLEEKETLLTETSAFIQAQKDDLANRIKDLTIRIPLMEKDLNDLDEDKTKKDLDSINKKLVHIDVDIVKMSDELFGLEEAKEKKQENLISKLVREKDDILSKMKNELDTSFSNTRETLGQKLTTLADTLTILTSQKAEETQTSIKGSFDNESKLKSDLIELERGKVLLSQQYDIEKARKNKSVNVYDIQDQIDSLIKKSEDLKQEAKALNGEVNEKRHQVQIDFDTCLMCNQKVEDNSHKQHLQEQSELIEKLINEKTDRIEAIKAEFLNIKTLYADYKQKLIDENEKVEKDLSTLLATGDKKKTDNSTSILDITQQLDIIIVARKETDKAIDEKYDMLMDECQENKSKLSIQIESEKKKLKSDFEVFKIKIEDEIDIKSKTESKEILNEFLSSKYTLESDLLNIQVEKVEQLESKLEIEGRTASIVRLIASLDFNRNELYTLEEDTDIDESKLDSVKSELNELTVEKNNYAASIKKGNKKLEVYKFWKIAFSDKGIPSMLIDGSIPFMNKTIREELTKIAPGKFIVSFDTLSETKGGDIRERFSVNVLNTETGADSHKLLSGGEKRQIDVCCMMVLRKLVENLYDKSFNIILLDEVLDSLDSANSSTFCQNLKALANNKNITLITHSYTQDAESDVVLSI